MDKTLDLDELERVAKRATQARRYRVGPKVYARGHGVPLLTVNDLGPSLGQQDEDATYIATFDPPTILTLIAAARPAVVSDEVVPAVFDEFNRQFRGMNHVEAMRAALALLPGGVPDGWVLVPKEPTEAMVNAVWHHWLHGMGHSQECMRDALRAMLSASPKGSPRSLPSRTAQEPPSPTPCDLEGK